MNTIPFDFHVLHTESVYSRGGEKYLYELLLRIAKTQRVHLYLHAISPKWRRLYKQANISVTQLWRPPRLFWLLLPLTLLTNYFQLKQILKRDSVVFATNFPMNFLAVLLSKRTICHCFEPLAIFYDPVRVASLSKFSQLCVAVAKLLYAPLDIWAYNTATILTALAPSVVPYILETYGRNPDIFLPNGVDTRFFSPKKQKKKGQKTVLTIGHSTDYTIFKGTENFLAILVSFSRTNIPFVAHISESIADPQIKKQYLLYTQRHHIHHQVRFMGNIDESRLADYYRSLDVFVYTGSMVSAGGSTASLSVLEAQACGTPVIRSRGDDQEIQEGKTGFYINPRNHGVAGKVIEKFSRLSAKEKNAMRRAARDYVCARFSWDSTSKVLLDTAKNLYTL